MAMNGKVVFYGNLNKDFLHLIARVVKIVMVLLGSIRAVGTLGVDVAALVVGLGLTGFGARIAAGLLRFLAGSSVGL